MKHPPNIRAELGKLKDFQRATADYVFRRLYGAGATQRFLVADEVGLGKTLVARGVIAKAIDRLWHKVRRIDIIYICSNADIARQNLDRLQIQGLTASARASRLTLLPLHVRDLRRQRVNLIALTPGTSFKQTGGGGVVQERALLHWLLNRAWHIGDRAAAINVLRHNVEAESFRWYLEKFDPKAVDRGLADAFQRELKRTIRQVRRAGRPDLRKRFRALCKTFCRSDCRGTEEDRAERARWLGEIRRLLAGVCLNSLRPDLVILDEFQRFRHLLDPEEPAGELASDLFKYARGNARARVMLLSATPYKCFTLHGEDGENHYDDLLKTLSFLSEESVPEIKAALQEYQDALLRLDGESSRAQVMQAKVRLEGLLRPMMVRTERLPVTADREGMLAERDMGNLSLEPADVAACLDLERIAEALGAPDAIEYWKSAPYVLNFMENYQLKRALEQHSRSSVRALHLARLVRHAKRSLLPLRSVRRYRKLHTHNPLLRALMAETVDRGWWRLLWAPPSLPYYKLSGPYADPAVKHFTKRLVFSSWHMVPKAVSTLLSYEAERQMTRLWDRKAANTPQARKQRRPLLRFARTKGRLTGLPLFLLIYPSAVLVRELDPRGLASDNDGKPGESSSKALLHKVSGKLKKLIRGLAIKTRKSGPKDERWYWLVPILLDLQYHSRETCAWWSREDLAQAWVATPQEAESDNWEEHVRSAWETAERVYAGKEKLGPPPTDLAKVLAAAAIGAPGSAALRALTRGLHSAALVLHPEVKDAAARIGRAFLSLFSLPEPQDLIRALHRRGPYWQRALDYCVGGCLQAVLDEYVHLLSETPGIARKSLGETAQELAGEIVEVVTLRTASLRVDEVKPKPSRRMVDLERHPMRIRFAMRFGDEQGEEEAVGASGAARAETRRERVRAAFNSPFWPFVLVTTSVGQEGLDFHSYCHAVVHWNLPANPVDLEQREGRVHRYKGHAVRKNIAAKMGARALRSKADDPWREAFALAHRQRRRGTPEIEPYWVYHGDARIERVVGLLPLSRDKERLDDLKKGLALYRLAFGHPRQEDLLKYLVRHSVARSLDIRRFLIDLRPPA